MNQILGPRNTVSEIFFKKLPLMGLTADDEKRSTKLKVEE